MIAGSANLAKNSQDSPEMLREKVTSPGGVTQKAIEEFEKYGMKEIIKKCMDEAEKKSIELGEK
jgi:pyrroline-5-carboxylate reductase